MESRQILPGVHYELDVGMSLYWFDAKQGVDRSLFSCNLIDL